MQDLLGNFHSKIMAGFEESIDGELTALTNVISEDLNLSVLQNYENVTATSGFCFRISSKELFSNQILVVVSLEVEFNPETLNHTISLRGKLTLSGEEHSKVGRVEDIYVTFASLLEEAGVLDESQASMFREYFLEHGASRIFGEYEKKVTDFFFSRKASNYR